MVRGGTQARNQIVWLSRPCAQGWCHTAPHHKVVLPQFPLGHHSFFICYSGFIEIHTGHLLHIFNVYNLIESDICFLLGNYSHNPDSECIHPLQKVPVIVWNPSFMLLPTHHYSLPGNYQSAVCHNRFVGIF